jgi:hypothetical protein
MQLNEPMAVFADVKIGFGTSVINRSILKHHFSTANTFAIVPDPTIHFVFYRCQPRDNSKNKNYNKNSN